MRKVATPLIMAEQAAPATPPTGFVSFYAKADGFLYRKDDAGTETQLGRLFIDDDTMATATATNVPSGESTKAYVDNSITALPSLEDGEGTTVDDGTPGFVSIDIVSGVDVQTGTGNGTWTKPLNVSPTSMTLIRLMGPGGGGGGARVAATGVARGGGGGGGAGCLTERWIRTSLLGATETLVCPAGGAAGAGGVGPTNNGVAGVAAADTTFGSIAKAGGGFGGGPGLASAGGSQGSGGVLGTQFNAVFAAVSGFGGPYGSSNSGGGGGVGTGYGITMPGGKFAVPVGNMNPGGGGGGGGIQTGTTTEAGCSGGHGDQYITAGGTAGANAGGAGGAGGAAGAAGIAGGGGGGGGSKNAGTGGVGGVGGAAGGGGGGGGASDGASSGNGGAGGAGGAGAWEIVTWL